MPFSNDIFDTLVADVMRLIQPRSCLDLGAGAGKYGTLVRRECPECHTTAMEVEEDYIHNFKLQEIYDTVKCDNVMSLLETSIDARFDVVIAGDVIEHLRKSEGIDLLHFLIYRTGFIIVVYPVRYLQDIVDGNRREAHISSWAELDFNWCTRTYLIHEESHEFVILRGYLDHSIAVDDLNQILDSWRPISRSERRPC